jgi:hypothetical protein
MVFIAGHCPLYMMMNRQREYGQGMRCPGPEVESDGIMSSYITREKSKIMEI